MIPSEKLTEFYTDAPKPHRNLILGSLQLVFWLYFHPTAWRHHLYQTDPGLDPNFALTDLTPTNGETAAYSDYCWSALLFYPWWPVFWPGSSVGS